MPRLRKDRVVVQKLSPNPRDDRFQACAALEVGENEWPLTTHQFGVSSHDVEARADMRCEVDLVDHEKIRTRYTRSALTWDLVASGDVDHIDGGVHKLGAEAGGEIVATRLQKYDVQIW